MSMEYKRVLVDMDNVMADFDGAALAAIEPHERIERLAFYVAHDYPEARRPSIEAIYNAPGFFEGLAPMPGMLEGWQALIDAGYYPNVASSPLSSNRTAIEGKIKWLDRIMVPEFGARVVEEAIIDKDKWKYRSLAMLDDRPDTPRGPGGESVANWEHILFGWPHLPKVPLATTAFRLLSWHDTDHLLNMLAQIEEARKQ